MMVSRPTRTSRVTALPLTIIGIVLVLSCSDRQPSVNENEEFIRLGFDILSNFKYDHYEVPNDVDGGRPFTRSDDVIPAEVKAYDGKLVAITGFVMPLRLRKGLVTEFLLFRDQASCCFGDRAKMNHYIRVKVVGEGFPPAGTGSIYTVRGRLKVGVIHVQGYLTGIYELEATQVAQNG